MTLRLSAIRNGLRTPRQTSDFSFSKCSAPIVSAHAQASIPLHLGQKVLKQLAQALMRNETMTAETRTTRFGTAASRWAGVGHTTPCFRLALLTAAVKEHTKPGDCVFDPFAGRATSLFAAASEDRIGLGIEINPVGWVYGKAKLQTAESEDVEETNPLAGAQG